jgi:putative transposase
MTENDREQALELRKARKLPWHSPPHLDFKVSKQYLISSSCYEHVPVIRKDPKRMSECESQLLAICDNLGSRIYPWRVLPNHYHLLLKTERIGELRDGLGQFHGRTSFEWNQSDEKQGRKVWYNCFGRPMKSERHFWASQNYVLHNPVHHGYVKRWQDWPWPSARQYLERVGAKEARRIWLMYPVLDYGKKWDI